MATPEAVVNAIAIVGMACRLPGDINTPAAFWQALISSSDMVGKLPPSRVELIAKGAPAFRWQGGYLSEVDRFDTGFFRISPREAEWLDPQQRLLMEVAWEALESAAIDPASTSGSQGGVYVGLMHRDYAALLGQRDGAEIDAFFATGNAASIAAGRLAYFLDWHGPALSLDTACSSSLVAVHAACRSLLNGDCTLGLVAGVNLILDDKHFVAFEKAGMLSPEGRCKSFDSSADGYARAEGCAALVLKRLEDAQAQGDPILAVIRGSAINQDGKGSGLTAPNQEAQLTVIEAALRQAGVQAASVDYLEAHGTGTPLGDRVEVVAAAKAYGYGRANGQPLLLGSVKSMLGHLESAAGIVGLIKTVLSLQHDWLPGQLHFNVPNPRIPWAELPVKVVAQAQAWPPGAKRAGVSSFGFSGTNAHVIVEAAPISETSETSISGPYVFICSARNHDRLKAMVEQMLGHLTHHEVNMADLSYTLQVGRQAMSARMGFIAYSQDQVITRLRAFVESDRATICEEIGSHDLITLLERWLKGDVVKWSDLYSSPRPRRIGLPTYPFAPEHYWLPLDEPSSETTTEDQHSRQRVLDPIIHRNPSTLGELRYSVSLTAEAYFLSEHRVQGRPTVPAVIMLAWAYHAASEQVGDGRFIRLEQVVWLRPLVVDSPLEVHIGLNQEKGGAISFEIYSEDPGQRIVFSQGRAIAAIPDQAPDLDIVALRSRCQRTLPIAGSYQTFEAWGIAYGPSFKVLRQVQVGDNLVVAHVLSTEDTQNYRLLPKLMDGALQACLLGIFQTSSRQVLPFTVQTVTVWSAFPASLYAVIRPAADDSPTVRKLNIDMVAADGRVVLQLHGFTALESSRAIPVGLKAAETPQVPQVVSEQGQTWELVARWEPCPAASPMARREQPTLWISAENVWPPDGLGLADRLISFSPSDSRSTLQGRLQTCVTVEHVVWLVPTQEATVALMALRLIKALLEAGYRERKLELTVLTHQAQTFTCHEKANPALACVHGVMGSLAKEYSQWRVRLLDLPENHGLAQTNWQQQAADGRLRLWREDHWHRQTLLMCQLPQVTETLYRKGGVYVVLGGAGGLGLALSEYLVRRYHAQLVWLGRRVEDPVITRHSERLGEYGPRPLYLQADATNRDALELAQLTIRERFGCVHGVVHSAVVLADQSLANMDEAGFDEVLTAKTETARYLDEVFGAEPLDFMLFFSSVLSLLTPPGQSNYVAGCSYIDAFAQELRNRPYPVKVMHWGYWGSVGIVAGEPYKSRMALAGFASVEPDDAMAILERFLLSPLRQMVYLKSCSTALVDALPISSEQRMQILPAGTSMFLQRSEVVAPKPFGEIQTLFEAQLIRLLWSQLAALGWLSTAVSPPPRYERWREAALALLVRNNVSIQQSAPEWEAQMALWAAYSAPLRSDSHLGPQIRLVDAVLSKLSAILTGEQPATEVLFPLGTLTLVEQVYRDHPVADYFNAVLADRLEAYVTARLRRDRQVRLRILEVGAGTGGSSVGLLACLKPYSANIDEYAFTDVSPAFVVPGQQRFQSQAPYLRARRLDIEGSPGSQGFGLSQYDVVVAANVLHATRNIRQTLRNSKTLLKSGGLLLLNELVEPSVFLHMTFGLLEGWWLAEDTSLRVPGSPLLSAMSWKRILKDEGFTGVDLPVEANDLGQQIIVARSDGVVCVDCEPVMAPELSVDPLPSPSSQNASMVLSEPRIRLIVRQCIVQALKFNEQQLDDGQAFSAYGVDSISGVMLVGAINSQLNLLLPTTVLFDYPTILKLSAYIATTYAQYREIAPPEQRLIEPSADGVPCDPEPGTPSDFVESPQQMSTPLASVVPAQEPRVRRIVRQCLVQALKYNEQQLEDEQPFSAYGVDSIGGVTLVNALNSQFDMALPTTVLFDCPSILKLSSYIATTCPSIGDTVPAIESTDTAPPLEVTEVLLPATSSQDSQGPTYYRLLLERPGRIEDLRIQEDYLPPLGPNDVRIAVRAFSLNFADVLCMRGLYPTQPRYPFTPGLEAAGIIVEIGGEVRRFAPGDVVFALAGESLGAHATVMTCSEQRVFRIPKSMTFETACTFPIVTLTMIECFKKAQLQAGERILIQTATGATGLVAVQLALYAGAQVYATASTQKKLDHLTTLGVTHAINYLERDFEVEVQRLTGGHGVDVIINTLPGDALQKGLNCLAPGGRYIEIAMAALKSAKAIDLSVMNGNQSLHCIDLRKICMDQPAVLQPMVNEMWRLIEAGVVGPLRSRAFSFDQVQQAYRCLEGRQNIGKVVVSVPPTYRLQTPEETNDEFALEPIAVIGMSGRFASTNSVEELWEALAAGKDLIEPVTRWDLARHYDASESYCRHGGFIRDIDCFDPLFFSISGREALVMDPQQRLFLEEAYHALENAGYVGPSLEGKRCGVYVGCATGDYQELLDQQAPAQAFWGNAGSVIAARIAYHLDLQGPAVAIDTACSSALVALHLACQGLRTADADLAIAGGVFVQSTEKFYVQANRAGMLSPTGHCHTFDAMADGFVPGEGVGALILKRLSSALADGDAIHGVIRGTGINQDGATNGITAPSVRSQSRLEKDVYQRFGIDPDSIQMVEAHGTGTVLGDPIEFRALTEVFGQRHGSSSGCAVGSIKSNLGHTAMAAGLAGVIKVLLALQHRQIPPSLHYSRSNPHIDFPGSCFYVPTSLQPWVVPEGRQATAAVSAFGFSGTNAHAVISAAPPSAPFISSNLAWLVALSARSPAQLKTVVQRLIAHCENAMTDIGAMSFTLLTGRGHFQYRLACVAPDSAALVVQLKLWVEEGQSVDVFTDFVNTAYNDEATEAKQAEQCLHNGAQTQQPQARRESLTLLAKLYTQGIELEWGRLFEGRSCRRVHLPTYPFAQDHYWPSPRDESARHAKGRQSSSPSPVLASMGAPNSVAIQPDNTEELELKLIELAALHLQIPASSVDRQVPLQRFGFDSITQVSFSRVLEQTFGVQVRPTVLFEQTTIKALAVYLLKEQGSSAVQETDPVRNSGEPAITTPDIPRTLSASASAARPRVAEPIAVIGMAGCFPGARNLQALWDNLVAGRDSVEEIPPERWSLENFYLKDRNEAIAQGLSYCKWGHFIGSINTAQSVFANALTLLIDTVNAGLSSAGYLPDSSSRDCPRMGLYLGASFSQAYSDVAKNGGRIPRTGAHLASRVSQHFGFEGSCINVDTHSASSMSAVHLACEALAHGDCDVAVAGGVAVLDAAFYQHCCQFNFLAGHADSRSFTAGRNGLLLSDGAGVVVLKSLAQAIQDGDPIQAVLKATASGHVENAVLDQMEALYRQLVTRAGIHVRTLGYIDAAASGLLIGDAIELSALSRFFQAHTEDKQFCALGSVQSLIGHAGAASGVSQLIVAILQLQCGQLLRYFPASQDLPFDSSPFFIPQAMGPWPDFKLIQDDKSSSTARRAMVNSMGYGGFCAGAIVEEYRPQGVCSEPDTARCG